VILTVGNTKGGVGKSTISINLAVEAAIDGKKVLLIDTDGQASSAAFFGERQKKDIEVLLKSSSQLHKEVPKLEKSFDLIIIDAGGRDSSIFRSAVAACHYLLMPIQAGQFEVWAVEDTVKVLREIQPLTDLQTRFVFNRVRARTTISSETVEAMEIYKGEGKILDQRLYDRTAFAKSISKGQGVSEYEPRGIAAQEIQALYRVIMDEMEITR